MESCVPGFQLLILFMLVVTTPAAAAAMISVTKHSFGSLVATVASAKGLRSTRSLLSHGHNSAASTCRSYSASASTSSSSLSSFRVVASAVNPAAAADVDPASSGSSDSTAVVKDKSSGESSSSSLSSPSSPASEYAPPAVPSYVDAEVLEDRIERLRELVSSVGSGQIVCLTGAGMSTESGVPDYRGRNGSYSRGYKPMTHDEFMSSQLARQRYWAHSTVGWEHFHRARPNAGHLALARLESLPPHRLGGIITQNVDGLHSQAGSSNVIDLHGRNDVVECMGCGLKRGRKMLQQQLSLLNREWLERYSPTTTSGLQRPDGDFAVGAADYSTFQLCACDRCGHFLKPHVVFFGDSVPKERVAYAYKMVDQAELLLVAGTSLMVYSGFRFVDHAVKRGKKVAIVNVGHTRAEKAGLPFSLKVEAGCGYALSRLADVM